MTPSGGERAFADQEIVVLFGSDGSGKTAICLDLAANAAEKGQRILYIDHEMGVDKSRFAQVAQARGGKPEFGDHAWKYRGMSVIRVLTLSGLLKKVLTLLPKYKPDALFVDTVSRHYLTLVCSPGSDYASCSKDLIRFTGQVLAFSDKWPLTTVFTTQPVSDVKKAEIYRLERGFIKERLDWEARPMIGGKAIGFDAKSHVELSKLFQTLRQAELVKHRSKGTGAKATFKVTDRGIEDA